MKITKDLIEKAYIHAKDRKDYNESNVSHSFDNIKDEIDIYNKMRRSETFDYTCGRTIMLEYFRIKINCPNISNLGEIEQYIAENIECTIEQLHDYYNQAQILNNQINNNQEEEKQYQKEVLTKDTFGDCINSEKLLEISNFSKRVINNNDKSIAKINSVASDIINTFDNKDFESTHFTKDQQQAAIVGTYIAMRHKANNRSFLESLKIFSNIRGYFLRKKIEEHITKDMNITQDCLDSIYANYENDKLSNCSHIYNTGNVRKKPELYEDGKLLVNEQPTHTWKDTDLDDSIDMEFTNNLKNDTQEKSTVNLSNKINKIDNQKDLNSSFDSVNSDM